MKEKLEKIKKILTSSGHQVDQININSSDEHENSSWYNWNSRNTINGVITSENLEFDFFILVENEGSRNGSHFSEAIEITRKNNFDLDGLLEFVENSSSHNYESRAILLKDGKKIFLDDDKLDEVLENV